MNNPNFPHGYSNMSTYYGGATSGGGGGGYAAASSSTYASLSSAPTASESFSDDDNNLMPWEQDNWVPRQKSGKQKTPNMVSSCCGLIEYHYRSMIDIIFSLI